MTTLMKTHNARHHSHDLQMSHPWLGNRVQVDCGHRYFCFVLRIVNGLYVSNGGRPCAWALSTSYSMALAAEAHRPIASAAVLWPL